MLLFSLRIKTRSDGGRGVRPSPPSLLGLGTERILCQNGWRGELIIENNCPTKHWKIDAQSRKIDPIVHGKSGPGEVVGHETGAG